VGALIVANFVKYMMSCCW